MSNLIAEHTQLFICTPSYLQTLLHMFKEWVAMSLVLECEDMFPWSGSLLYSILARSGHYTLALGMMGE